MTEGSPALRANSAPNDGIPFWIPPENLLCKEGAQRAVWTDGGCGEAQAQRFRIEDRVGIFLRGSIFGRAAAGLRDTAAVRCLNQRHR